MSNFASVSGLRRVTWEGVAEYIERGYDPDSKKGEKWREQFLMRRSCSLCHGTRLKAEALQFRVGITTLLRCVHFRLKSWLR